MSAPPPSGPPPSAPAVPEGWKAEWSGEHNAWYILSPLNDLVLTAMSIN